MTVTTVITPDFVDSVNQEFFIESQGGPQHPISYLDRFPNSLYSKAIDSNLVTLMYALLGPAGVGGIKHDYLVARLMVEAAQLGTTDLDQAYSNPLAFARIVSEQNNIDSTGLLTPEQQAALDLQDSAFRNRVIDFLHAVRAGGTPQGISLAAQSGLGHPVEVIENYRALYDNFSDNPLGLPEMGLTRSTEEVIVLPRPDISQSAVQTLTILGAQGGTFVLVFPIGGNYATSALPYNAPIDVVQAALSAIPSIGIGNVHVSGGPLPDLPVQITFTRNLANQTLPLLQINTQLLTSTIVGYIVTANVTNTQVGISADSETVSISPQNAYYMQEALNNIKPVTTIVTPGSGQGANLRQSNNAIYSQTNLTGVVRYVLGNNSVPWPAVDSNHWIEAGIEHEAPRSSSSIYGNYQGFHNIANVFAYTEEALADALYETTTNASSVTGAAQWPALYNNERLGLFSPIEVALYPFFEDYTDPQIQFSASGSIALQPEPLTIGSITGSNVMMINNIYPIDYQGLAGAPMQINGTPFWSSRARETGTDYLEIDLGAVQAVNFIYFEATNKPYSISVDYELFDQAPTRSFSPVSFEPSYIAPSITSLAYNASVKNPWTTVALHFTNSLENQIFTRFLRIGFTRISGVGSPFIDSFNNQLPYGLEVKNLRIGRNVS